MGWMDDKIMAGYDRDRMMIKFDEHMNLPLTQ